MKTSRHIGYRYLTGLFFLALLMAAVGGCGKGPASSEKLPPVSIHKGDECHVCGMVISRFPGPKGEAYVRNSKEPLKFCSTRDMFAYLLQPEARSVVTQVYVQDMAKTDWQHPSDTAFVDAKAAWYVIDQPLKGAMGPTLASFAKKEDAQHFIDQHGGRLLGFDDITLDVLSQLNAQDMPMKKMGTVMQ